MNTETADRSGEPASRPFVSQRGERNETNHDTSRGRRADTRCAGALPRADPAQKRRSVVMAHDDVNPDAPKKRLVIKKMVLENFKSYAGAQHVGPFHKSFSSVVGPNGSGKSNVIDAMLFVFGKRAKQLRLNKVSELIHNSTDFRNLEYARVEVHFHEIVDKARPVPNARFGGDGSERASERTTNDAWTRADPRATAREDVRVRPSSRSRGSARRREPRRRPRPPPPRTQHLPPVRPTTDARRCRTSTGWRLVWRSDAGCQRRR